MSVTNELIDELPVPPMLIGEPIDDDDDDEDVDNAELEKILKMEVFD